MDREPVQKAAKTAPVSIDDTVVHLNVLNVASDDVQKTAVKRLKLRRRLQAELNDEDIERHMDLLRTRHTQLSGLQPMSL